MPNTSSVSKDITVTLKTIQHDKISAPRHTHLHGRIFVFATFTNTSDHTYWISTWGTPLGRNHFFDGILKVVYEPNDPVKRRILPYDALPLTGRVMKIKDYIKIPAKTSLKAVLIELTEFVDIDQTGEYEITMECHIKNVTKGAFVWPGVRAFNDPAKPTKLKIVGDGTAVIKSNTITKNLTAQHDFSLSEVFEVLPDRVSQGWSSSDVIKPPKFAKGSVDPDKVEATTKAHYAAAQYLTFMDRFLSSERDMTEDPTLMAW
jgi:hypothetical protein